MKPWWKSKTIWFNFLALLSTIAAAVNEFLSLLEVTLDPKIYAVVGFVVAVVNLVLRKVTTEGIVILEKK